ncbi:MAG: hypothetical protein LBJ76_02860 [Candidatus Accumulibacter sp.]|nr:hypothetical protein [Accumulibacter sp.]
MIRLSELTEQNRSQQQDAQIQKLATRLGELAQQIEQLRLSPDAVPQVSDVSHLPHQQSVPQARYGEERHALEQRLTDIEQTSNEGLAANDPRLLIERLDTLDAQVSRRETRLRGVQPKKLHGTPSLPENPTPGSGGTVFSGDRKRVARRRAFSGDSAVRRERPFPRASLAYWRHGRQLAS